MSGVEVGEGLYSIPQEMVDFRETIRQIATEKIAPRAAEIDRNSEYPWDVRQLLGEQDILGLPFEERGPMTDEYIKIMRELWTNPSAQFDGAYTSFSDVEFRPLPAQQGGPPIWVGGSSRAALRRTAEHGDAWHPINRTPAQLREGKADILKLCERFGRATPPELTLRIDVRIVLDDQPYPKPAHAGHMLVGSPSEIVEQIEELREIGIEHLSLEFVGRDFEDFTAQVDAFAEQVRPRLG